MSQLIQMRSRIKAIETTQKITHAMQLISMSNHSRLRDRKTYLEHYYQTIMDLFASLYARVPGWHHPFITPTVNTPPLIVIIGSQKGLCGTFNTNLVHSIERDVRQEKITHGDLIIVGKKVHEYFAFQQKLSLPLTIQAHYDELTRITLPNIVESLFKAIMNRSQPYSSVMVYANQPVSFFVQRPQAVTLIPYTHQGTASVHDDFIWEDDPATILDAVALLAVKTSLHHLLMRSLLAEQAARFISMDNATRNAKKLRDAMLIQYNKVRQTKITKELTELSSGFSSDTGT